MAAEQLILIVHDVRSAHNVGSLFRSADAFGVDKIYLTGITPRPGEANDSRLPHEVRSVESRLNKTALGATKTVKWQSGELSSVIADLKQNSFRVGALELTPHSRNLPPVRLNGNYALLIGNEIEGLQPDILSLADEVYQIPMSGSKESLNVVVAAGIALYHLRYIA